MKHLDRFRNLAFSLILVGSIIPSAVSQKASAVTGTWQGVATVRGSQVPITLLVSRKGSALEVSFANGPAAHPELTRSASVTWSGGHLVASFDYFARALDATLTGDTLTGTYGAAHPSAKSVPPTSFTLTHVTKPTDPIAAPNAPDISGSWEIAAKSAKGENAWEFRAEPAAHSTSVFKTVIQRIDGDTGGLWGTWNGSAFNVSHFTAAGPALYAVTPQADGTLLIKNVLGPIRSPASAEYVARRPAEARKLNLPTVTDPAQQTSVKDPSVPFAFSFPDLNGNLVSNTDPRFHNKVVIVAIGGSWCPNCHDEAPLLVSLYNKYHSKGLEIVNLDFEQGDPDSDTPRLKAFIAHYGIAYPVLLAGTTDQLNDRIPQGVNLNCWPTAFFLGRDGLVKETHAGFAGPGNTAGHQELVDNITKLVEKLLAESSAARSAVASNETPR